MIYDNTLSYMVYPIYCHILCHLLSIVIFVQDNLFVYSTLPLCNIKVVCVLNSSVQETNKAYYHLLDFSLFKLGT